MRKRVMLTVMLLIAALGMTTIANAAITASEYIDIAYGSTSHTSGNKVTVDFDITGTDTMDKIGAKTIILQEQTTSSTQWTAVKTFSSDDYPNMLKTDAYQYSSSVSYYEAKPDCSYRAKIYFYAEKGGYDTVELITPAT